MALVIEDGSGVAGANSYVTVQELTDYAAARKITLPEDDADKEVLLIKAMDYLDAYEDSYYGDPYYIDDEYLSWPRIYYNQSTGIPEDLKTAQIVIAIAAQTVELFPVRPAGVKDATRETVGPITVEYARGAGSAYRPSIPQADALLRQFFVGNGQLQVIRG